jgi:hypothetical protein
MVQAEATSKFIRTSAQKAGLVLDLIRGKDVIERAGNVAVHAQDDREGHRKSAALGDRQRAGQERRRRSALRERVLRGPGPEHEAHPPCPDGPGVPRREAYRASHGRGRRAAGESRAAEEDEGKTSRQRRRRRINGSESTSLRIPAGLQQDLALALVRGQDYAKLLHEDIKLRAS